jgi:hypothetical protein
MSWLFSQALVEEYSEATSLDGEPSVQSSGNHTQLAYLQPDKMTDFSRLSRFGMTFAPLTADRGEALLMSYLAGFHARTSALQAEATDLTENGQDFGEKWRGWLAKFDPVTSTLRTAQCSLLEEEPESLQTLPRSGMTRSGMLWARQTLVPHTSETESGFLQKWPTPVASDWKGGHQTGIQYKNNRFARVSKTTGTEFGAKLQGAFRLITGNRLPCNFAEWMMGWPRGWTDLKPLEMDKFQQWQQQHGVY